MVKNKKFLRIIPTPPAPPIIKITLLGSYFCIGISITSNLPSKAVKATKENAAALAKLKVLGFLPTILSSTT